MIGVLKNPDVFLHSCKTQVVPVISPHSSLYLKQVPPPPVQRFMKSFDIAAGKVME
jgi:hypothetical protein